MALSQQPVSDALVCLTVAVGGTAPLTCPCPVETTTTYLPTTTTSTTTLPDPCDPNPCQNGGECTPLGGGDVSCYCFPEWTGPTCEQCGTPCSENEEFLRGRFLSCVVDTEFCDRPYATCPEFCAQWMGCAGELYVDETYGTVTGIVECF